MATARNSRMRRVGGCGKTDHKDGAQPLDQHGGDKSDIPNAIALTHVNRQSPKRKFQASSPYPGARTPSRQFATSGTFQSRFQQELEKFFIVTDELEDKNLEIIGWKGPKIAMKAMQLLAWSRQPALRLGWPMHPCRGNHSSHPLERSSSCAALYLALTLAIVSA